MLSALWKYVSAGNSWTELTLSGPQPPARYGSGAAQLPDGSVLIIGGTDAAGSPTGDLWRLHTDNSFTELSGCPDAYYYASAEVVGDTLYVFGEPNLVDAYNIPGNSWTSYRPYMPVSGPLVTAIGPNPVGEPAVYIFGGISRDGTESNQVYEFDPPSGTVSHRSEHMPLPLAHGAGSVESPAPPEAPCHRRFKMYH